ncbi:MAG: apolipoprotein N-acyltransferase [Planctomycetota bacterium]
MTSLAAGLVYALCTALAFEPFGLWPLTFIAVLPLGWLADRVARSEVKPRAAGLFAMLGALPWWIWATHWTAVVSTLGFIPLPIYLSLYAGLFVWLGARFVRARPGLPALVWLPVLWVGLEWLRGTVVMHGYPWYFAAHPLVDGPAGLFTWPARAVGAIGVSVLAVVPAALAIDALSRRRVSIGVAGVVTIAWIGFGLTAGGGAASGETTKIAVIQTNVPQSARMGWPKAQRFRDWVDMRALLAEAVDESPDLIVFPEGLFPGDEIEPDAVAIQRDTPGAWDLRDDSGAAPEGWPEYIPWTLVHDAWMGDSEDLGIPMIVGGAGRDGAFLEEFPNGGIRISSERSYNSVFVIDDGAVRARYDKLFLVPFGERMPYVERWPWLQDKLLAFAARGMRFILSAGDDEVVFEIPGVGGVATPICFEAAVSRVPRKLVFSDGERSAEVMVNITNDGWFGSFDAGRRHHLQLARWRCVELATPMARSANTGVSALVDAWGREIAVLPAREEGVLTRDLVRGVGVPMYATIGDAVGWIALVGAGVLTVIGRGRRPDLDEAPEDDEDDECAD